MKREKSEKERDHHYHVAESLKDDLITHFLFNAESYEAVLKFMDDMKVEFKAEYQTREGIYINGDEVEVPQTLSELTDLRRGRLKYPLRGIQRDDMFVEGANLFNDRDEENDQDLPVMPLDEKIENAKSILSYIKKHKLDV